MNDNYPKNGERVEFASHFVPKCGKLLDIGCGDGLLEHFIKDRVSKMYGIDNEITSVKNSQKYYFEVKSVNVDEYDLPYKNNFFDVCTSLDVVEHVKDPNRFLNEIQRVLNQKGLLIISTPNIRFSDHIWKLLVNGIFPKTSIDTSIYDGGHIHFFTYKDLFTLLIKHGFKIIRKEGIINKEKRGWKGRFLEFLFGKELMNEFRSPGILFVAQKI